MPVADINDRNDHPPRLGKELPELRENEMDTPAGERAALEDVVLKIGRNDGRAAHVRRGGERRGVDIPTDALTPEACAQLLRQRIAQS